jgi:hypothetical protein
MDLDGTLLCGQGEVSAQNMHALDEVRDSGVEIVVATGRCYTECKHILNAIDHLGVSITAGGSKLTNRNGETIKRDTVDYSVVSDVSSHVLDGEHRCLLLKDSNQCGVQYVLVGDAPLHSASTWWFESLGISLFEVDTLEDDPWPQHTLRVGAVAEEKTLLPIAEKLDVLLTSRAKMQHWSAVTCSEATGSSTHLLEVFSKSVNKWTMLERHLGTKLQKDRVAAIGDGLNDIEVLQEVGLSIVMENANDEVQQHAHVLAGHHNDNGFAKAMQRWIIPESKL